MKPLDIDLSFDDEVPLDVIVLGEGRFDTLVKREIEKRRASGEKGHKGKPGGSLATGPKGLKGDQGASQPCTTTISQDTVSAEVSKSLNKAIIALDVEKTSDTTYALIAKRGIVGNPDAAPSSVNVNCGDVSTWVLAVSNIGGVAQPIYYIDMSGIISLIQNKFISELQRIKNGHEAVVQFWLDKMSKLFYQQKAAMCCAVTRCEKTNAEINQGVIDPFASPSTTTPAPMLAMPKAAKLSHMPPKGALNRPTQLTIDGTTNVGAIKHAAELDLPSGHYAIKIIKCCIKSGNEFVADVDIIYNHAGEQRRIKFDKPGEFTSEFMAEHAYGNATIDIDHSGGLVKAYLQSSQPASGSIIIDFIKINDAQQQTHIVSHAELMDYKSAWDSNKCFGLIMNVANQNYIIVKPIMPPGNQPALAWPTLDNKTFVNLSNTSEYHFKLDELLNNIVAKNLQLGVYLSPKGQDIQEHIGSVLFPILS